MALDKVLKIYDENGNQVDYDILASDVKFLPDGKDLPTKLTEMEDAIEDAAEGGGYTPPQGGIPKTDLASDVQTSLGKADTALQQSDKTQLQNAINSLQSALNTITQDGATQGVIDTFNEVKAFLDGIDTDDPTLANQLLALNNAISAVQTSLATKANSADVYTKTEVDTKVADAGSGAVSVTTNQDGTFVIHVGSTDYTINLNHTHENMAKLIVCEESGLPSTLDPATIYAITDSGETEIEKLIIRGMEFAGGGVPDTGEPMISSPSNGSTINLGDNTAGQGVSKTITVKGKNLTGDLTVAVGTGLTISYGQSTGQSSVTIPMAQALLGAQVTISYSGTGALDDGSLVISHGGSVLSSVVVVVVVEVQPIAVKFTGSQWVNTGVSIGPSTSMKLDIEFLNAFGNKNSTPTFLSTSNSGFAFNVGYDSASGSATYTALHFWVQGADNMHDFGNAIYSRGVINYSPQSLSFLGWTKSVATKTTTSENLAIGYGWNKTDPIFNHHNFKVYGLEIYESGVLTHHFVPKNVNGVTGLYDTETGNFITSETSTELEAVYEQSNS